jgi:hypothetical protein
MSYETALKALRYGLDEYLNILKTDPVVTPEAPLNEVVDQEYAVFQHSIEGIFVEVKKRTATLGKFLKDPKTGEKNIDDIAMTDDERDIFDSFNKLASVEIFNSMTAYTKKILTAFLYDEGPTITSYSPTTAYTLDQYVSYNSKYYLCIQDGTGKTPDTETEYWQEQPDYVDTLGKVSIMISFPPEKNANTLKLIDNYIFNLHIYFVMGEWMEQVGKFDLALNWKEKFKAMLDTLKWTLTKSKSVSRPPTFS